MSRQDSEKWGTYILTLKDQDQIAKMKYMNQEREQEIQINKGDFQRLMPSVYLNDIIINFYLK